MSNVAFSLTNRERDVLLTLEICRAAWPNFDNRTWLTLARKGLVGFGVAPDLTDSGKLANSLTRALGSLTRANLAFFPKSEVVATRPADVSPAGAAAAATCL